MHAEARLTGEGTPWPACGASSTVRAPYGEMGFESPTPAFRKSAYAKDACRRIAKMSALSKVKMSVSCPLGSRDGGGRSDGRGADEQTRTQPDRYPGPPGERPSHPRARRGAAAGQ